MSGELFTVVFLIKYESNFIKIISSILLALTLMYIYVVSPVWNMDTLKKNNEYALQFLEISSCPIKNQKDESKRVKFNRMRELVYKTCLIENATESVIFHNKIISTIYGRYDLMTLSNGYNFLYKDKHRYTCIELVNKALELCPNHVKISP